MLAAQWTLPGRTAACSSGEIPFSLTSMAINSPRLNTVKIMVKKCRSVGTWEGFPGKNGNSGKEEALFVVPTAEEKGSWQQEGLLGSEEKLYGQWVLLDFLEHYDLQPKILQNRTWARKTFILLFWLSHEWLDLEHFAKSSRVCSLYWHKPMMNVQGSSSGTRCLSYKGPSTEQGQSLFDEGSLDRNIPFPWRGERSYTCEETESPKRCCWNP